MSKKRTSLLLLAIGVLLTVFAGRYGKQLFSISEYVHFSINFPTAPGLEQLPRDKVGGPWAFIPREKWAGYPAGGLIAWGQEGAILVDLGQQGTLKKWMQPDSVLLSSHWVRNIGVDHRAICFEVEMCGFEITFDTFETGWDADARCSTRKIAPTKQFNMDWIFTVPPSKREHPLICEGTIQVLDRDTKERLSTLPVTLINSANPPGGAR